MKIFLPDGKVLEVENIKGKRILDLIPQSREYLVAKVDGKAVDLTYILEGNEEKVEVFDFKSDLGRETYWHTSAHILAQAVKELFPDVKITIGPAIENGFYYDFDLGGKTFTPEDLKKIEEKMREIIKRDLPLKREILKKDEAIKLFKNMGEDYKIEILEEIPDEYVSVYRQGDFVDLCRGPHLPSTGYVRAIKILSSSSSYWRGDETREVLQRVYGISFPDKSQLKEYMRKLEEAKARDHRKLGRELDLFSIDEDVGPGLILWHPKGATIRMIIEDFWRKEHIKRGYQPVYTPHVGRAKLWEISGHLEYYKENMYPSMKLENVEYYIKPMNCPFHILIYKSRGRSYRDLPIRYAEMGTVYRYERSGVLHGLLRVRGFTQDDAHIFCTPEQVEEEIVKVLDFTLFILKSFGFKDFNIYVSTRPEDSVGSPEMWELATESLIKAVEKLNLEYSIDEGGGAFYGPKIDVKIKDALGRDWQCSTIQFDFNLPERFDITYRDKDGKDKRPYMIHRALLGSMERFLGTLIEHYAGNFPVWLAPVQVAILPITTENEAYAQKVYEKLIDEDIRAYMDVRTEKIGYKIREAESQKIPYMLIIGKKEEETGTVSVRKHRKGDIGSMKIEDFINLIKEEINKKEEQN
ncbi:MAG TPA: threonine--tRNA ligase [candidate division WOR-3 bacterium]|uniref:Threonine--tRNA ligase n=1 Tax=candidate division WOR-3 bacterium TaxID=2052148 RepID=A0A7V5HN30_UNCW3|nr:threonine--tRNA ligase [candidate division WOR-3 bacterium]